MNIIQAIDDPKVFAQHFRDATWDSWRAFLGALFALEMSEEELSVYRQCTGRSAAPTAPSHEAWLMIGRRGGKSFVLALIAVFLACFKDWRPHLGPGEVGTVMVVAADRRQARVIMRYVTGLLKAVPMLKRQVESVTRESIALKNSIVIEVHTASFRSTRGYTIVAALLDEIAFWPTDENAAAPDAEVLNAIKPGMATIPAAMLLCASSPYARRGALWDAYRKHHGKDGDPVLVSQAATRTMNPSVPQSFIDAHLAEDEARATAEYLAIPRADLEAFVTREAVLACVAPCVFERPKQHYETYAGFADPSGGSQDSFTLAIGHQDIVKQVMIVDAIREVKPPFSPEAVCAEFATLCKSYGINSIIGDRYAGGWPVEQFGKFGIRYEQSAKAKSELYLDLLAAINSRRVSLLDHGKLINQLCRLERSTARSGRESIDHAPGAHDDIANAVAGLCAATLNKYPNYDTSYRAFAPDYQDPDAQPPAPAQEPEPPGAGADWWRGQPRSPQTSSANQRLFDYYKSIDLAFKGFFR